MALIPITDVLSKDQNAFKVQGNGIYDHRGLNAHVSIFGDSVTARRTDDVSVKFQYNNAPYEVTETVSGTGAVTNANSKARVATGVGIGNARLETNNVIKYRPGHEGFAIFTAIFSTGDANVDQMAGPFDSDDGFWVGYQGTQFGFAVRVGGVDTFVPQSSWNGDQFLTGAFILNPQTMNIYRISYGWLGIAPAILEVSADNGENWTVAHTIDYRNSQTTPIINNPILPLAIEVDATVAPSADTYIEASSLNGGTVGGEDASGTADRYFSIDGGSTTVPGATLTNILTVRNPATYKGKANKVKSQLLFISITCDGTQDVKVTTYKNATLGGTPNFVDVSTDNSQLQYDTAGTTVSGGSPSFPINLGKVDSRDVYTKDLGLFLSPGDDVTFAALSASSSEVKISIRERSFF